MKLLKRMMFFVSAVSMLSFISCSGINGSGGSDFSDSDKPIVDNSPTSYTNLSFGRTYIGGSLVYNPSNQSTNQLNPGTLIAVREGKINLVKEMQDVYELPESSSKTEFKTSDVNGESSDLQKISREVMVYKDDADKARYGYIQISSVSDDSISFSYTRYNLGGNGLSTRSYTLTKGGDSIDLDNDGRPDLRYREPNSLRDDFENACWLEFVCNPDEETQENPSSSSTMMFSVISNTTSSERSLVRAVDGAVANQTDYGFYGVNTNGNYIFILKDDVSVNSNGGSDSSFISNYDLKYGDYVILHNEEATTNANAPDSAQSFVVSFNDSSANRTTLNNVSISSIYRYNIRQFQSNKGPKDLLKRMPNAVLELVEPGLTAEKVATDPAYDDSTTCLNVLNEILSKGEAVSNILLADDSKLVSKGKRAAIKRQLNELSSAGTEETIRKVIDSVFPQSPKAALSAPTIESMYPYLSLNLGNSTSQEAKQEYLEDYAARSAARMAYNVEDYTKKKKAIEKKFAEYFAIELKKVSMGTKKDKDGNVEKDDKGNDKKNEYQLKDYGVKLALGVKGSLSINAGWDGSVNAGLGGVIYMDIGLSLLEKGFDEIKKPLEDMLKTEFKTTTMIGAVPVTIGVKLGFGLDLELSTEKDKPIDLAFCYVGMYGAGINAGANWGTKWLKPYLHFHANTYTVNETEWYFGAASGSISDYKDLLNPTTPINATLTPSVTIEPLVGLGPSWANFNVSVPVKPSLPLKFKIYPIMTPFVPPELQEIDLGLEIKLKSSLDISILVFKVSHTFCNIPLVDKTGNNAWVLWKKNN